MQLNRVGVLLLGREEYKKLIECIEQNYFISLNFQLSSDILIQQKSTSKVELNLFV